jgi:hypothetical protein
MEEILASIRRIIADDQDVPAAGAAPQPPLEPAAAAAAPASDDILDLAELSAPEPAAAPAPEPAPEAVPDLVFRDTASGAEPSFAPLQAIAEPQPVEEPVAPPPPPILEEIPRLPPILEEIPRSAPAAAAPIPQPGARPENLISTDAMASVGNAFSMLSNTVLTQNARTLEDLVGELLKPMLKGWLDEHLPPLVERLVRAEIERVARGGR